MWCKSCFMKYCSYSLAEGPELFLYCLEVCSIQLHETSSGGRWRCWSSYLEQQTYQWCHMLTVSDWHWRCSLWVLSRCGHTPVCEPGVCCKCRSHQLHSPTWHQTQLSWQQCRSPPSVRGGDFGLQVINYVLHEHGGCILVMVQVVRCHTIGVGAHICPSYLGEEHPGFQ